MKITDCLVREAMIDDLKGVDKESVISELLASLSDAGAISEEKTELIKEEILTREKKGSTGIGNGVAIPHTKVSAYTDELIAVFGRSRKGVDFAAIDGGKVYLFFLIVTPQVSEKEHLEVIKEIAIMARDKDLSRWLLEAEDLDAIWQIFREVDERED